MNEIHRLTGSGPNATRVAPLTLTSTEHKVTRGMRASTPPRDGRGPVEGAVEGAVEEEVPPPQDTERVPIIATAEVRFLHPSLGQCRWPA